MAVNNSLANSQKRLGISAYMSQEGVKAQINKVVGKNSERFVASIISAVNQTPALQECTNKSILAGALVGEALKLSPSPVLGNYYLVPYDQKEKKDKDGTIIKYACKVAQFQLGYKGYIQLALRSGQYKKLNVMAIKEGELIRFDPLNEDIEVNLITDEVERENAETIGYYAMFEYINGFRKAMYWSKEKMEAHAMKYSKGYQAKKGYTFWEKDFDAMAYKTMLRQLISKWGIMSIDMITALDADMAVINEDGSKDYIETEEIIDTTAEEVQTEQPQEEAPAEQPANDDVASALFGE